MRALAPWCAHVRDSAVVGGVGSGGVGLLWLKWQLSQLHVAQSVGARMSSQWLVRDVLSPTCDSWFM